MAQRGKDNNTSTAEGLSRPAEKPHDPAPAQHGHKTGGDGHHEMPEPGERVDDEAEVGQKRMTRQE